MSHRPSFASAASFRRYPPGCILARPAQRECRNLHDPTDIQRLVNNLFERTTAVSRLDAVVRAESLDMPEQVRDIVALLPPGNYRRQALCDQLNSAITAHGLGRSLGTVE